MSADRLYAAANVYGHALELLREGRDSGVGPDTIHLDLACGYARIGEPLQDQLPTRYVGLDPDPVAVAAARDRGLEVHEVDLLGDGLLDSIVRLVGDRPVGSISYLDSLGSLDSPQRMLDVLAVLARRWSAIVVVSVPNATHNDVAFKMALGAFTRTSSGLLDANHRYLFGAEELTTALLSSGLHVVGRNDVCVTESDQRFPKEHIALIRGTNLNRFLIDVRSATEPSGRVQQFVWRLIPGPRAERFVIEDPSVFITVVIRTVGRRIQELSEVLLCLAAQSDQDFDVVILGHNLDEARQIAVEGLIEDLPDTLASKTTFRLIDHGTRATLLNIGFTMAAGRYVTVLDDDDLVFAHWIESFHTLESAHGGKILRGVGVLQEATRVTVRDRPGIRAEGELDARFEREFVYVDHLRQNQSPLMTLAFPIGVFRYLGVTFDETLTTTEDWDYLLRAAALTGVADSRQIVAVYHWWVDQESSRTDHDAEEWRLNQVAVDRKIDGRPILLAPGETRRIRQLVAEASTREAEPSVATDAERESLIRTAAELLESNSWKVTAPIRLASAVLGRGSSVRLSELLHLPSADLRRIIAEIQASSSWRRSRFLRRR